MSVSTSQVNPLTTGDTQEAMPAVHSTFRKKFGIPPKGTPPPGGWADSDYGFPLPPSDHPLAYKFARAVLSRAHQNTKFDPARLAKVVSRAKAIVAKHDKGA
ncbi:MAG TPA: hypothetical protein VGG51_04160 [Candidatus Cybelea sp.]|jgi:hypothetical protein